MNVNVNRVMEMKKSKNPVQFSFNRLKYGYTNVQALEHLCCIKELPINNVMENSKYIYSEPNYGASFFYNTLKDHNFKTALLTEQHTEISKYIKTLKDNRYKNSEHLKILENTLNLIDSKIKYYETDEYMRESFMDNLLELKIVNEGILSVIKDFISSLTKPKEVDFVALRPKLLDMVNNEHNVNTLKYYLKDAQLAETELRKTITKFPEKKEQIEKHINWLDHTYVPTIIKKIKLIETPVAVKESKYDTDAVTEPNYDKLKTIAQLEGEIKYFKALKREEDGRGDHGYNHKINKILTTLYEKVKKLESKKATKESMDITDSNIDDLILSIKSNIETNSDEEINDLIDEDDESNDLMPTDIEVSDDEGVDLIQSMMEGFIDFILDGKPVEEVTYDLDQFNKFANAYNNIFYIFEDVGTVRKFTHKVRSTKKMSDRVATKVDKTVEPINRGVSELIDSFKKVDETERRNRIVEGKFRFKLLKIIRDAIATGALFLIHPALAAVAILAHVALDHKADKNVRRQLTEELKEELRMVEEKIDDAKSEGKKTEKYQLMRIKIKLAHEIDRIEYHLDRS